MGGMKISDLDFLHLLPAFMRDDEAVMALSKAVSRLIGEPGKRLSTIRTWDKIDELNEAECDELAWELDVDWYDSTGMGLSEKRETLKLAQQIKRKRGTKWAVERLISAYFGDGYVMEWYEAGSAPYTFMVITTSTNVLADNFRKFVNAANAAKNERSHCLGIFYLWEQGPEQGVACALSSSVHKYDFRKCGTYPRPATLGFVIKPSIETEPEATAHSYDFKKCGANSPKKCVSLVDMVTGGKYMLFVEGGKMKMKPTSGNVTAKNIFFNDTETGTKYMVFVSNGKLRMQQTSENTEVNSGLMDDISTNETYLLYVSSGRLRMKPENAAIVGTAVVGTAIAG